MFLHARPFRTHTYSRNRLNWTICLPHGRCNPTIDFYDLLNVVQLVTSIQFPIIGRTCWKNLYLLFLPLSRYFWLIYRVNSLTRNGAVDIPSIDMGICCSASVDVPCSIRRQIVFFLPQCARKQLEIWGVACSI